MTTIIFFILGFFSLVTPAPAQAVCPVCTVAVVGGLGISKWLGIDDTVTGVWIGGLIISSGLWLADWIEKRGWKLPSKKLLSIVIFFVFVIPPLYLGKMIGVAGNVLWGIDRVLLGTIVGSTLFFFGAYLDGWLRITNGGKVYVYYQKVIVPVFMLTLASFVFFRITL